MPSSFLIDRDGRLRTLYKGPVSVDTLLHDARLLDLDRAELLANAVSFPGRWLHPPKWVDTSAVSLEVRRRRFCGAGQTIQISSLIGQRETHPEYLSASLLNLYAAIFVDQQQLQQTASAFAEELMLDPGNRQVHMELGTILFRFRKGDQTTTHFEELLKFNPNDPELLYKIGSGTDTSRDD